VKRRGRKQIVFTLLAILLLAAILFPVYYMVEVSVKPQGSLATTEIELIPEEVTLDNYRSIIIGQTEGSARGDEAIIRAESAVIRRGDSETTLENCTIRIAGGVTLDMKEPEILELIGGEDRGDTIVSGELIRIKSTELITTMSVDVIEYNAERFDFELELKGVIVEAENAEVEMKGFRSVRITKVGGDIWLYLRNSLVLAALTVIFSLILVIPGAYSFSRLRFAGKGHILYFYLMFTQVSGGLGIAGLIALYGLLVRLNFMNNLFAMALVYSAGSVPYNTWLMKTYLDSISFEFDEAAFVDGAGYLQTLRYVILPMSLPGITTVAVFAFMAGWTELVLANLFLSGANTPLSVYLYVTLQNMRSVPWNSFAATALIFAIPPALMFMFAQRYIRSGLTLGGLKE
jgi:arabinogalactan oligomer/maltooligosaccharide transport system permease protein